MKPVQVKLKKQSRPTKTIFIKAQCIYYEDNFNGFRWYAKIINAPNKSLIGKEYRIINETFVYIQSATKYSTPKNDIHPKHWSLHSKLKKNTPSKILTTLEFWSPFKPNLIVYGLIDKDTFKVTKIKNIIIDD